MALQLKDRVRGISTTTGTGTYTISSTPTGYEAFSEISSGSQVYYVATDENGNWEVGYGTVSIGSSVTLTRTEILASSNSGSAVNWGAGDKDIRVTFPAVVAQVLQLVEGVVNLVLSGSLSVAGAVSFATKLSFGNIAELAGVSVLGRSGNTSGEMAAITAGAANQVLMRVGNALAFSLLGADNVANGALTFAKLASLNGLSVLGRSANSTGVMAAITASTDGQVLRRNGTSIGFGNIAEGQVTQHVAAINHNSLLNYAADQHRKITISSSNPSGGANNDIWLKY